MADVLAWLGLADDPGKMGFNAWTCAHLCPVVSELLTYSPELVNVSGRLGTDPSKTLMSGHVFTCVQLCQLLV